MEIRDHNLLLLRLSSSFSTTRRADIPPQSISSISFFFFLSLAKKYTETESDRTGVSEMERSKEKGQAGGEKKEKTGQTYAKRRRETESEGGRQREQLAASSCCDLSALTGMSGANTHLPCPLGQFPWKRYFSPLHILYTVCSSSFALYSQQSACRSNGLYEKVEC